MTTNESAPAAVSITDLFTPGNNAFNERNISKHILSTAFRWKNVRLFLNDRYLDPTDRNPKGKNYFALTDALIESLSNPQKQVEKKFIYEGDHRLYESLLNCLAKMFAFLSIPVEIEHEEEVLTLRITVSETEAVAA